jgi:hypothetical protein
LRCTVDWRSPAEQGSTLRETIPIEQRNLTRLEPYSGVISILLNSIIEVYTERHVIKLKTPSLKKGKECGFGTVNHHRYLTETWLSELPYAVCRHASTTFSCLHHEYVSFYFGLVTNVSGEEYSLRDFKPSQPIKPPLPTSVAISNARSFSSN